MKDLTGVTAQFWGSWGVGSLILLNFRYCHGVGIGVILHRRNMSGVSDMEVACFLYL